MTAQGHMLFQVKYSFRRRSRLSRLKTKSRLSEVPSRLLRGPRTLTFGAWFAGSSLLMKSAAEECSAAREIAEEMSAIGRHLNDPRPRGMGMGILGWIALTSDDYGKALNCAEECLQIAYTPQERMNALGVKGAALALLRRLEEGQLVLSDIRRQLIELNWRYELLLLDPAFGVLAVLNGKIGKGVRIIESVIATARRDGWRAAEDWAKLFLCEVYLEVMFPKDKPPLESSSEKYSDLDQDFIGWAFFD